MSKWGLTREEWRGCHRWCSAYPRRAGGCELVGTGRVSRCVANHTQKKWEHRQRGAANAGFPSLLPSGQGTPTWATISSSHSLYSHIYHLLQTQTLPSLLQVSKLGGKKSGNIIRRSWVLSIMAFVFYIFELIVNIYNLIFDHGYVFLLSGHTDSKGFLWLFGCTNTSLLSFNLL